MPSRSYDEWLDLLRFFQLNENPIYVLGCFARHVTVYSQQVRALNLVAALKHTQRIPKGAKVAVIGGGAAGMMAAAAAAFIGADVTLLDELAGPMALQRNNRQRWLHPYIYDWPFIERSGTASQLPLLSWQADYASDVAEQIEKQWRRLTGEPKRQGLEGTITPHWNVTNVDVEYKQHRPFVSWTDLRSLNPNPNLDVDLVIMAVGFGLEPDKESWQHSYWTEDDLDGDFRRRSAPWLVSGIGDGGLTDVMRLCIGQFRHHEVEELFGSIAGIDMLKLELKELHPSSSSPDAESVHKKFKQTLWRGDGQPRWPGLTKVLRDENRLRDRASVILASESRWIYGPGSSLLNRLIISQLEQLGLITFKYGRVDDVSRDNGGTKVSFLGKEPAYVNRVLLRHGPKPALERFTQIWADSLMLQTLWKAKGINRDQTRMRLWDPGEFGPEDIGTIVSESPAGTGLNIRAERLSVTKELRDDGSSYISYEIQGLSILGGSIRGIQFDLRSTVGTVGVPELNEDAKRLGIYWEEQSVDDRRLPLGGMMKWLQHISRILYIPKELQMRSLNFGFTVSLLNADALSIWELEQLYTPNQRKHVTGEKLVNTEFLARYVWFPVDELKIRITLPTKISSAPFVDVSICGKSLQMDDWFRDRLLHISPPLESMLHPSKLDWPASPETRARDSKYLANVSPRTWELVVPKPDAGSCYSLNWELSGNKLDSFTSGLVKKATNVRRRLIAHGQARTKGDDGEFIISSEFSRLANALQSSCGISEEPEELEICFLTYNDSIHELAMVEAIASGVDRMEEALGNFRLPFGTGLAGAAFKEADKVFLFRAPYIRPSFYLPLDYGCAHSGLLAIPLDHPSFHDLPSASVLEGFERSRQCLGVLTIGSSSKATNLTPEKIDNLTLLDIQALCRTFISRVVFQSTRENQLTFDRNEKLGTWTPRTGDTFSITIPSLSTI